MIRVFRSCLLLSVLIAVTSSSAFAELKVATVDIAKILNESGEAKSKRGELDSITLEAKKKLEARAKEVESLEKKLKESADTDSPEGEELKSKIKELSRLKKDLEEDLRGKFMKSNKALTDKALAMIESYAKEAGYDLVLDRSTQGKMLVVYGDSKMDITDVILKRLK